MEELWFFNSFLLMPLYPSGNHSSLTCLLLSDERSGAGKCAVGPTDTDHGHARVLSQVPQLEAVILTTRTLGGRNQSLAVLKSLMH